MTGKRRLEKKFESPAGRKAMSGVVVLVSLALFAGVACGEGPTKSGPDAGGGGDVGDVGVGNPRDQGGPNPADVGSRDTSSSTQPDARADSGDAGADADGGEPVSLRAWYPFNDAESPEGEVPDHAGSFTATNFGMQKQQGHLGFGLAWTDDGQALRIPEAVLDNLEQGTMALWLRRDDERGVRLFGKVNPGVSGEMGVGLGADGTLRFNTGESAVEAMVTTEIGAWHHLAFTWGPEGKQIFFDGALVAADNQGDGVGDGATHSEFGRDPNQPNSTGSRGALDEIRIYDAVLTEEEIEALASEPAVAACPDGEHVCDGICVAAQANNDPSIGCSKGCGEPCPQPPGMTAVCTAEGTCDAICAMTGADPYEPNDDEQSATMLETLKDFPDSQTIVEDATIVPDTDVDWYGFEVQDGTTVLGFNGGSPVVRIDIPHVPLDTEYDLALWYTCQDGTASHTCNIGQADARYGDGCKAVRDNSSWVVELRSSCTSTLDHGDVLVRVERLDAGSSCPPYSLDVRVR